MNDASQDAPDISVTETLVVPVELGERAYEIQIGAGLLEFAGSDIAEHLPREKTLIITDENVAGLHLPVLEDSLRDAGIAFESVILPPGEATKCFARLEAVVERILEAGLERNDAVIAFGGGVIGDLAGFAAAIARRGMNFIQIPTTLLAQVDSSVGGKTGINSRLGKNLIGAFHQPRLVLADTAVLDTLPRRELLAGYAEVVKYGLLGDAAFFAWLEEHGQALLDGDMAARQKAIARSCEMKAEIVAADEREAGRRALLNLGHTFGHALEAALGYDGTLLHGEAVAIGMAQAFRFSERLGLCERGLAERVAAHLASVGLPVDLSGLRGRLPDAAGLLSYMRQDKKARQGRLVFILVRGIGEAFISADVSEKELLAFLEEELAVA
jgi:3-dehydroquinate synthase